MSKIISNEYIEVKAMDSHGKLQIKNYPGGFKQYFKDVFCLSYIVEEKNK